MFLDFGRDVCGQIDIASKREWLVTNGIGSYASGTVANMLTRRYHGLLVAALRPPLGRTLLLAKLDETAEYDGISAESGHYYPLFVNRWSNGGMLIEPSGHHHINRFHLEGTTPVWTYACADALLEKRIWMQPGANTTYIHYRLVRAGGPLLLQAKAFANYRDYHETTIINDWQPEILPVERGLRITMYDDAAPYYLYSDKATLQPRFDWYEDFLLAEEEFRGQNDVEEDHIFVAQMHIIMQPGETVTVAATTESSVYLDGEDAYAERVAYEQDHLRRARKVFAIDGNAAIKQLVLAADQFIVRRPTDSEADGRSVIAGYPWFSDWGRDTMIALPGLTLATGRTEIAASILRTYARFVDKGMIPNRFPDEGALPEYNTADASLWYVEAIRRYYAASGDISLLAELFPVLEEIIKWYRRGTRYNIHMDDSDALIYAGEEGMQLTWMDAKVDDWVVTPRIGKPVEVNALWYNALNTVAEIARDLGENSEPYETLAGRVKRGFNRFWNEQYGYCYDVLDMPEGRHDAALRPNQLLAVSLPNNLLTPQQQRSIVDACGRDLLTAHGLRTLSPEDDDYIGHYGGDQVKRDGAYHQGTTWAWLMGPFVEAHLRVYNNPELARSYLTSLLQHLRAHGVGSISEIFDGDPPFTPRGCIAQAWSVAEILRVWLLLENDSGESHGDMIMNKIHELNELGQSIWYDNIERSLISGGELRALIDEGITGVTSNPSIFQKAITGSDAYSDDLRYLVEEGKSALQIFESLAVEDIQHAADLLYPVYEETNGNDGYVSLEVNPNLAHDTEGTIAEARRLFSRLGRPNAMIKVPATQAGIPAISALIGEGININVTLLFSNDNYEQVAKAYIEGLETLSSQGGDLSRVASVASFFVSRVDSVVDKALEDAGNKDLQGEIAIANAKVAYTIFEELFSGSRWQVLADRAARPQRLLWASTSTKNPAYPNTMYVDGLIGPQTVNTAPPATIEDFRDHGTVAITLTIDVDEARRRLAELESLGIDLDALTAQLQTDGVASFAASFNSLMDSIEAKRRQILAGEVTLEIAAGASLEQIDDALAEIAAQRVIERIWDNDYTVWKPRPDEISNRLDWLTIAEEMSGSAERLREFAAGVRAAGFTDVVLLGMGGSSLAPEVFRNVFGTAPGYLNLTVVDSTDPGAILAAREGLDLRKTLFIVATKSGGTSETLSFFKYFYNQVAAELGAGNAGEHFVAITDSGSKLEQLAQQYDFRDIFLNNPNIGGRYSALSYFGLVPASLIGVDIPRLLDQALIAACSAGAPNCAPSTANVAAVLGAAMGVLAAEGRDKLTFIISPALASFGDWVEQLIAESTGKDGKGILPVVGEETSSPQAYGQDRVFVYLKLEGDAGFDAEVEALETARQPVIRMTVNDLYELGRQFFLWEMATAVAGHLLGIQPFDQPNVEEAKVQARQMITAYEESGVLPASQSTAPSSAALKSFLDAVKPGDYIAIQAYVKPSAPVDSALNDLRTKLRDETGVPVTVGYGPRFLHSTGQLHKGDAGNGWFIQLTAAMPHDVGIPDQAGKPESSITFGVLKTAQALGDGAALQEAGRPVVHFYLGDDIVAGIETLAG